MDGLGLYGVILVGAVVVTALVTALVVRRKDREKLAYMLDAFEDGELNFRFREKNAFNRTLNRIRWIFERQRQAHEQDSWTKLIRVLTHEIMNTVAPIAALSDAMGKELSAPKEDASLDIRAGLETISASSKDLIRFVESYRALSGVARPVKKGILLQDVMDKVLHLTGAQRAEAGVACSYEALSPDILLYADEGQISQIFINLIKNAAQAGATVIRITASLDKAGEVRIRVTNNGAPISKESQEQIFVPFFTTKRDGSGIGLSISRQIMRLHGGTIDLVASDASGTTFELLFR